MKKFLEDFKAFVMRGNVVDMAVGVIIGAAFGKIVSSLVADVVMPGIGLLVGGMNFTDLAITLKEAVVENGVEVTPAVLIKYGAFIQVIIDFIIIAFAIFLMVKGVTSIQKKKAEEPAPAPEPEKPTVDQELLTEIRDLLKKNIEK